MPARRADPITAPVDVGAQVLETGVGQQCDHLTTRPERLRHAHRRDHVRPRRGPGEQGLVPRQAPCHLLGVVGLDGHDLVHERRLEERRRVADAHAFDLVRPGLVAEQHRRLRRLDGDDLDPGRMPLQHGGDAARGSRRAHAVNESVDLPLGLTPDLLAERVVAGGISAPFGGTTLRSRTIEVLPMASMMSARR
jgi:hypothetical protein